MPIRVTGLCEFPEEYVRHIVQHLRARDRAEIFALRWDDNEDQLICDILRVAGPMWRLWCADGEPVAMNGIVPTRPGVASASAFGTDKWRLVLRQMSRWSLDHVIPALQAHGYHRGEAWCLAANVDTRAWLEMLGADKEAYCHQMGRNCEDFILYTWRLNDVLQRQRRRQQRSTVSVV